MTKKGNKQTEQHKINRGIYRKGKEHYLFGEKDSLATRKKKSLARLGKKNPGYGKQYWLGKKHTEETKRKIGLGNKGKTFSDKTRKLMSISRKRTHNTLEVKLKLKINRLNQISLKQDTSIERSLQKELRKRNIKFNTHLNIENICQPDIIIKNKKIIVQADGDYWHNLPLTKERDKRQDELLKSKGWIVVRFWEHEIKKDTSCCVDIVENIIDTAMSSEVEY